MNGLFHLVLFINSKPTNYLSLRGSAATVAIPSFLHRYCKMISRVLPSHLVKMMGQRNYYVYILTNKNHTTLYTGVTNNLLRRIFEHKQGIRRSFSHRYNLNKLVFYEIYPDIRSAINREKQIKAGPRRRKLQLIEDLNPDWDDLFETWQR